MIIDMKNVWKKLFLFFVSLAVMLTMFQSSAFPTENIKASSDKGIVEDAMGGVLNKDIKFTGTWYAYAEAGRHGGSKGETTQKEASLEYTFTGSGIDIYAHINPTFGSFKIYIDDEDKGVFSLRDGSVNETKLLVAFNDLLPGTHTIRMVNVGGTSNIDYFKIKSEVTIVDDSINNAFNPDVQYKGGWYVWTEAGRYGGAKSETTDTSASLSYTFNGVGIEVYSHINPGMGSFHILIDDVDQGVFSLKDGSVNETRLLASFEGLLTGNHTIQFTNISGKVNLDYFNVYANTATDSLALQIDGKGISVNNGLVHLQEGEHALAASYTPSKPNKEDTLNVVLKQDDKDDIIIASETLQDKKSFLVKKDFSVEALHNALELELTYNDQVIGNIYERIYNMPKATTDTTFQKGDLIGLIGDSITHDNYAGMSYASFIYNYYVTRFPNERVDILNLGICSYTAKAVLDTFDRDYAGKGLTKATIMLGMNDVERGLYDQSNYVSTAPRRAEIRNTYQTNMMELLDKFQQVDINREDVTLITPSIYDQTRTSNINSDGSLKTRVNDGLAEFSEDIIKMSNNEKTKLVQLNDPMLKINKIYQIANPNGTFTQGDLIHPNPMGHNLMGYLFLQQQGAPKEVASVSISNNDVTVSNAQVDHLKKDDSFIRFTYQPDSLPMAVTDAYIEADTYVGISDDLNQEVIQVQQLDSEASYTLMIDKAVLGTYKGSAFERGINIAANDKNPNQIAAKQIEQTNQRRKNLESDINDVTWFEYLQRSGYQSRTYITDLCTYNSNTLTYTLKDNAKGILDTTYGSDQAAKKYYDMKANSETYRAQAAALRDQMYEEAQSAVAIPHNVTIAKDGMNTEIKMPNFFAENMVLQRDKPHTIWGMGIPNQNMIISLADDTQEVIGETISDSSGKWTVDLEALPAQSKPYTLTVNDGYDTKTIPNVFVGDVFVCAGQSNMELRYDQIVNMNLDHNPSGPYDRSETPALLNNPNIKFFTASWNSSSSESFDVPMQYGNWSSLTNSNNSQLSYLAMYFAKDLLTKNPDIPVGLMSVAWGGTPITRWMKSGDAQIYNNHIAPLTNYNIAGILWYQGEDDAKDTYANDVNSHLTYRTRMSQLINEYREAWQEDDLPFIYAQLARYSGGSNNGVKDFQAIRQAQLEALDMVKNKDNVSMVTTIDTDMGTAANIHPLGKDIIAKRMANAFVRMRNDNNTVTTGPLFKNAVVSNENESEMIVSFKEGTANKLQLMNPIFDKTADPDHVAVKKDGNQVSAFEIAGADKVYHAAKATIQGDKVVVSSEQVKQPVYVRYAYDYAPKSPDLYNAAELPASPFTSEKTYKVVTIGDSITEGYGVVNNGANRYSSLLNNELNQPIGLGTFHVVNRGRSGTTMNQKGDYPYWTAGPWNDALRDRGDIYTIALGTNDSKPQNYQHVANFKDNYNQMIRTIREYNPNAEIYVCKPVPALLNGEGVDGNGKPIGINNANVIEIGKLIDEIAEENNLIAIDLYDSFQNVMKGEVIEKAQRINGNSTNGEFPTANAETMTKYLYDKNAKSTNEGTLNIDRIHPGAYGHELIADTVYDVLYKDLTISQADRSALLAKIAFAETLIENENDYTTDSWDIFEDALQNAKQINENESATQTEIDNATFTLNTACDQLQKKGSFAKTILETAINKTEGYIADGKFDKLASSVQNLIYTRLAAAKAVLNDKASRDPQYLGVWLDLADALHYLDFKADKNDLATLIEECNKIDTSGYVEGVEAFHNALTSAQQVFDDANVLQDSIDIAYKDLMNARDAFVLGNADKALLQSLINKVTTSVGNSHLYTQASWESYLTALDKANAVLANEDAMKAEIEGAFNTLAGAYEDLRLLPNEALLIELNAFIEMIGAINMTCYSEEDRAVFMNVRDKVEDILRNPENITDENQAFIRMDIANVNKRLKDGKLEQPIDPIKPDTDIGTDAKKEVKQPEAQNGETKTAETPYIAKTGDATNMLLINMLGLASLGIMTTIRRRRNSLNAKRAILKHTQLFKLNEQA